MKGRGENTGTHLVTTIATGNLVIKQSIHQVKPHLCLQFYFRFPLFYRPVKIVNERISGKVTFSSLSELQIVTE